MVLGWMLVTKWQCCFCGGGSGNFVFLWKVKKNIRVRIIKFAIFRFPLEMEQKLNIEDLAAQLDYVGVQFMATVGLDGRPKVRPMQYMVIHEGKLWFCTNSEKEVYAELRRSPYLELCGSKLEEREMDSAWVRFSAEAVFEDNRRVKELIVEKSEIVRTLYLHDLDNPIFKVFYLRNIEGVLANLGHVRGREDRPGFKKPVNFSFD